MSLSITQQALKRFHCKLAVYDCCVNSDPGIHGLATGRLHSAIVAHDKCRTLA